LRESKSEFDSYLVPGIKDSLASSSEEIANDLWESILSYYQPKSTFSSSFPSMHLHSIKQVLCTEWSVFKKEISDDEWYKTVLPLMRKYLDSDIQEDFDRLCNEEIGLLDFANPPSIEAHSIFSKYNGWKSFSDEIKHQNRFHCKTLNESILIRILSKLVMTVSAGNTLYRARVMKEKKNIPFGLSEMGMPPIDHAYSGRMNPQGIPYFYLSENEETAIHEVRSALHDFVTVAQFSVESDINLIDLRGLRDINPFWDVDLFELAVNKGFLNDMYMAIISPMRKYDTEIEYIPTQYLAELIKTMVVEDGSPIDGIVYPSVMNSKLGLNYLLFSESKMKGEAVSLKEITQIEYDYKTKN